MDVNAVKNNTNAINAYNNSSVASQNVSNITEDNSKVSNNKPVEKNQEKQMNQENKDGIDKEELDKAVKKLNKFLEDENTHAEYSIHKDLGTLMIKIVDDEDKIVLELPPEKILDMVASMCKQVGLFDKKA